MPVTSRAVELYKAQYRYIDQSCPGGYLSNQTLTDIGATHFPLMLPPRIMVRTFFLGHHSQFMMSPFKDIENNVQHAHHMSVLYLYTTSIRISFDKAVIILHKVLHTSHDS